MTWIMFWFCCFQVSTRHRRVRPHAHHVQWEGFASKLNLNITVCRMFLQLFVSRIGVDESFITISVFWESHLSNNLDRTSHASIPWLCLAVHTHRRTSAQLLLWIISRRHTNYTACVIMSLWLIQGNVKKYKMALCDQDKVASLVPT